MSSPKGNLTGTQIEIMEAVWSAGKEGVTVGELWERVSSKRPLARTTVLTQVSRLTARGWLVRDEAGEAHRYHATRSREQAIRQIAAEFVDEFFGGSASELVMSLLGSKRIKPEELKRLRALLEKPEAKK